MADVTLTFAERLLLANQFKILEALDPKSASEYSQSREIVEAGYQYLYETINPSISTVDMPVEASQEVGEILDMFRALEHSSKEIGKTTEELEVCFEGFDANNDDHHYHFAKFTRRKLMNWVELLRYPDNSHTQSSLPRYRSMVENWRAMGKPHTLSEKDIAALAGK